MPRPPPSLMLMLRPMLMLTTDTTDITMLPTPTVMPDIISVRDLLMLSPPLMLMPMPTTDTTATTMLPTPTAMPTTAMLPMLMAVTDSPMAMESKKLPSP